MTGVFMMNTSIQWIFTTPVRKITCNSSLLGWSVARSRCYLTDRTPYKNE